MPHGTPSKADPKSGCNPVALPTEATSLSEFGCRGILDTSKCQGLSEGKKAIPERSADCRAAAAPQAQSTIISGRIIRAHRFAFSDAVMDSPSRALAAVDRE